MGTLANILLKDGEALREAIARNMADQKRNATGDTVRGIKVEANDGRLTLTDTKGTLIFSEVGRGPNRSQPAKPSQSFIQQLKKWTLKKGIKSGLTDKQRTSLAYAIGLKIARSGNKLHRSGKPSGVISDALNQKWLDDLTGKLTTEYTAIIQTQILKQIGS